MEDPSRNSSSIKKPQVSNSKKSSGSRSLVASVPSIFKRTPLVKQCGLRREHVGDVAIFLVKVAGLELIRRLSNAKFPFAWQGLQALQILCYPPFKWIQRWGAPFKGLVLGMQKLSKPLFFLSIATALSDQSDYDEEHTDDMTDSEESQLCSEPSVTPSTEDTRAIDICDQAHQSPESENWLVQLHKELENQGIALPERINEDELRRFYTAADGNFSCLILSIKKTIRWRETYHILSVEDLEMWSKFLFWHGYDVKLRPCLFIRLGLACNSLSSPDKPRFAQAIVSQVEQGILRMVNKKDPQITVVVDCEGLSPSKLPMQILRSCSTIMQDNYPNCLGWLILVELPPDVRVIVQTFIQDLKPITRNKLIEGKIYKNVLFEYIQDLPSYLGGKCTCLRCSTTDKPNMVRYRSTDPTSNEPPSLGRNRHFSDLAVRSNPERFLRTGIIAMLMFWIVIGFLVGMYDPPLL